MCFAWDPHFDYVTRRYIYLLTKSTYILQEVHSFLWLALKIIVIFLIHFTSGKFAVTRDGLDSRGAARHRVSPNHPEFQQNSPRAVVE